MSSFLLLLALLLLVGQTLAGEVVHVLERGSQERPVTLNPELKAAYVSLHYEGTDRDDAYVLGLRTLIQSIKLTGTDYPVIVLCAKNVAEASREAFLELGAEVRVVDNIPNPYKYAEEFRRSYKPRFEFTFNKLYLWNLTEFDRVTYMDADNIVLYNMDELFLCGHFCAVFMNMIYFHTGLLVVKPDRDMFEDMLDTLQGLKLYNYDGADQGFLTAYFDGLEKTPLFRLEDAADGNPLDHPGMRLPMEYNVNQLYYYLTYDWDWLRPMGEYFADYEVPALSMAFPIAPEMKPWYWLPTFFFESCWTWQKFRSTLPGEEYWTEVWLPSRVLGLGAICALQYFLVKFVYPHGLLFGTRTKLVDTLVKLPLALVKALGYVLGVLVCFVWTPGWAATFVHQLTPPSIAWYIYISYRLVFIYMLLYGVTAMLTFPRQKLSHFPTDGLFNAIRPPYTPRTMIPAAVLETVFLLFGTGIIYPGLWSFVGKLICVIIPFFLMLCVEMHMFRTALEACWTSEVHRRNLAVKQSRIEHLTDA